MLTNNIWIPLSNNNPSNRNLEIINRMSTVIDKDFNIVIWSDEVREKDINEMIMNGLSQDKLIKIIEENTYSKLSALTKLSYWRKR